MRAPVLHVVEDTGVASRRHDGLVARAVPSPAPEAAVHQRLHLPLAHPGSGAGEGVPHGIGRHLRGPSHPLQLPGLLHQPHVVQHLPRVGDAAGARALPRAPGPGTGQHPEHQRLDPGEPAVQAVEEAVGAQQELGQLLLQRRDREHGVGPEALRRALGPQAGPCPQLGLRVPLPHEEDEALLVGVAPEHRHRLGLHDPRQVEELAVRTVRILRVSGAPDQGRRGEHHGARPQALEGAGAAAREGLRGKAPQGSEGGHGAAPAGLWIHGWERRHGR